MEANLERLTNERAFALRDGASDRRARERIMELLDPGSFIEVGLLARDDRQPRRAQKTPTDGLIAGYGTIHGHRVGILSHDREVLGGSTGHAASAKEMRILQEAERCAFPVISLGEGGGGRIPDLMGSSFGHAGSLSQESNLGFMARRKRRFTLIGASMDEMYGDPSFALGLSDFTLMVRNACFGVSGPPVIMAALGEEVTGPELGGPQVHEANGQVARVEEGEAELLESIRSIIDFTEDQFRTCSDPENRPTPEISRLVPESPSRAYDMRKVIRAVADQDCPPLYLWEKYGASAVAALARFGGRTVALFASQPLWRGGVMDTDSSRKGIKLIDQAHRLGLPLVFLSDLPGFIVGKDAERQGLLQASMDYLRALVSSEVPKISIVLRKAYGFGYFAMGGPGWGGDYVAALPSARIAFMGPEPGINVIHGKRLAAIADETERERERLSLLGDWGERAEPWEAAWNGCLDDIIPPDDVRSTIIRVVRTLERR